MIEGVGWEEMKDKRRNNKLKKTFYLAVATFHTRNH